MFQTTQTKQMGYKLFNKGNGVWNMLTPTGLFVGSWDKLVNFSVLDLGFSKKELEFGRKMMEENFHNAAEYGIYKSFIFSYDAEERNPNFSTKH